ncbi:MAG: SPOR domain-containing protein [Alphaproteobacteria bacterium]|nr:SPOR domain-containing protein [Alphaproteobacteria bacterium]MDA8013359.1 SPOR domain-containing protein [Alphaproteobacteria bacterium]
MPEEIGIERDSLGIEGAVREETLTIDGQEINATVVAVEETADINGDIDGAAIVREETVTIDGQEISATVVAVDQTGDIDGAEVVREETLTINGQEINATIISVTEPDDSDIISIDNSAITLDDTAADIFSSTAVDPDIIEASGGTEVFIDAEPVTRDGDIVLRELFYIQVGAFRQEENANKLAAELSTFGVAQIQEATVSDETYFRVRLGPFHTPEETQALATKLIEAEYGSLQILRLAPTEIFKQP